MDDGSYRGEEMEREEEEKEEEEGWFLGVLGERGAFKGVGAKILVEEEEEEE